MKKNKLILSIVMVLVLVLGVFITNINAAEIRGKVEVNQPVITKRGDSASITYTITTNNTIDFFGAHVKWDTRLGTLDGEPEVDQVMATPNDQEGDIGVYHIQNIIFGKTKSVVTFKFKNVLPEGTTETEFPITFEFGPGSTGFVEFGDDDGEIALDEIDLGEAKITLDQTVAVALTPATSTVLVGETKQFTSVVTNDDGSGVTYTVSGNTSSDTNIDATGLLTIASDETEGSELIITATSVLDNTKSATATVIVTIPEVAVLDVTEANKVIAKFDATDKKLYTEASYKVFKESIEEVKSILNGSQTRALVHVDQAKLDAAVATANTAFNNLVKIAVDAVVPTTPAPGNKIPATGMSFPVLGLVLILVSGSTIVLRRRFNK